jgi:hypothetical protein
MMIGKHYRRVATIAGAYTSVGKIWNREKNRNSRLRVSHLHKINPYDTSMLERNLSMAEARMCFSRAPSTVIPVRS